MFIKIDGNGIQLLYCGMSGKVRAWGGGGSVKKWVAYNQ